MAEAALKRRKQSRPTPQARDRRAKFVELATNRVNRALKDMALIGNLANRRNYDYDDDQAKKIVKALQLALDELRARFASKGGADSNRFEL